MLDSAPAEVCHVRIAGNVRAPVEIAAHLVACQATVMTGLTSGEFSWDANNERYAAMSLEAMLEDARDLDALLIQMVQTAEEEWFDQVPSKYNLTRQGWLWETLDHEIHHVGQLATLIRLAGGEPARIFG